MAYIKISKAVLDILNKDGGEMALGVRSSHSHEMMTERTVNRLTPTTDKEGNITVPEGDELEKRVAALESRGRIVFFSEDGEKMYSAEEYVVILRQRVDELEKWRKAKSRPSTMRVTLTGDDG